jgi:hypothetical protein
MLLLLIGVSHNHKIFLLFSKICWIIAKFILSYKTNYFLLFALFYLIDGLQQSDIGPLVGVGVFVYKLLWSVGLSILGWLIWRAFRGVKES